MSAEGHWCGPSACPECGETHTCICGNACNKPVDAEQEFRDWITADFKAGKLGIENGWLVEYNDPCPSPCGGGGYGCPPSCMATPLVDLWQTQRSDAEKGAEWEAVQGEPGIVCAWCPAPARGDAWHNDGRLHPSCGQVDHGQGWVPGEFPVQGDPTAAREFVPTGELTPEKEGSNR